MTEYTPRHAVPDAEPFPFPVQSPPAPKPVSRRRRPILAALGVLAVTLGAAWWLVGPNERNCERQIDSYLVKMLASKTPIDQQATPDASEFWRCWGLSGGAKRRAASGAFSRHIGEMVGRAFDEAFTSKP